MFIFQTCAMDYYCPLLADGIYHICSRAVGKEKLFITDENYRFFLARYDKYISPLAETFAWALLPNHFHFLIRIKPYPQLQDVFKKIKPHGSQADGWQPVFVMKQFSNLLNSYTKSFNRAYGRKGSLFMDYMRRVRVTSADQYMATVFYIHKNPVQHGCCKALDGWRWSSYRSFLSPAPTKLLRQEVFDWFGGIANFEAYHKQPVKKL